MTPAIELPWDPPVDLSRPVDPPLQVAEEDRSPELLRQVVAQFRVEEAERYRRRDVTGDDVPETFCNFYVRDLCLAYGAPLPALTANDLVRWWSSIDGSAAGWVAATEIDARRAAAEGQLAVAAWLNGAGHGHVALLVPPAPHEGPEVTRITQAGRHNFTHGTLAQGFGRYPSRFYIHHHRRICR